MPPKGDRERQKREEAERKAREEEEEGQRREQERLEQEEKEKQIREDKERIKAEEESRFAEEQVRVSALLERQRLALDTWKQEQWQQKQWAQYVSCRSLPDPSDERALNTYLSLSSSSRSSRQEDGHTPCIETTLAEITDVLNLVDELEELLHGDCLPTPAPATAQQYQQAVSRAQGLVWSKLEATTRHYLQFSEKHISKETFNLEVEGGIPLRGGGVALGLWGNVVKDPRLKSFSFKQRGGLEVELPKPLLLKDVAVRVIYPHLDPLSPLTHSYSCKRSPLASGTETAVSSDTSGGEEEEGEGEEGEAGEGGSGEASVRPASAASRDETQSAVEGEAESVPTMLGGDEEAVAVETASHSGTEPQTGEGGDGGDGGEGGEGLLEDEVDLRAYRPAGGPVMLQLLEMPPQPKSHANNWTVRKNIGSELTSCPYPAEVPRPPTQPGTAGGGEEEEEEDEGKPPPPSAPLPGSLAWPAITITMGLPERFVFTEKPQLARWDAALQLWRTDGLQDVLVDLEERSVSFQTYYFAPLTLMADLYVNMPYQSWEVWPQGEDHTHLTITGGATEITVEIKRECSRLLQPSAEPCVAHLINQPMSTHKLIQAMAQAGLYFFPEQDADKYVSISPKSPTAEQAVYRSMGLASTAFAFQWSRWNAGAGHSRLVLLAADATTVKKEEAQVSWSTYIGGRKSSKLAITEDSAEFSAMLPEGCTTHVDLYSSLESGCCSEVAKTRLHATSPVHVEAVQQWLAATRPLTFS